MPAPTPAGRQTDAAAFGDLSRCQLIPDRQFATWPAQPPQPETL